MKILHLVSYAVFSGPLPGVATLASAQRAQGHDAYIMHDNWRGNFSPYEETAQQHKRLVGLAPPCKMTLSAKGGLRRALADGRALRTWAEGLPLDVVHCHLSHDHLLAALFLRPTTTLVRTVHAARSTARRWGSGSMWRRTRGVIVRDAGWVAPVQRLVAGRAVHHVPGSLDLTGWSGAGMPEAERAAWRGRRGIDAAAPVVVHAALMADRGQAELIGALGHLWATRPPELCPHLVLVGRGPQEMALRRQVRGQPFARHVHFLGYLEELELQATYAAADLAFIAQPGNDGAARAALEAIACHLPLVAVPFGALQGLVATDTAFLASGRSPQAIAHALELAIKQRVSWPQRAVAARQRLVAQRAPAGEAQATLALYQAARAQGR